MASTQHKQPLAVRRDEPTTNTEADPEMPLAVGSVELGANPRGSDAGGAQLPDTAPVSVDLSSGPALSEKYGALLTAKQALEERNAQLYGQLTALSEKYEALLTAKRALEERNAQLSGRLTALSEKHEALLTANRALEEQNAHQSIQIEELSVENEELHLELACGPAMEPQSSLKPAVTDNSDLDDDAADDSSDSDLTDADDRMSLFQASELLRVLQRKLFQQFKALKPKHKVKHLGEIHPQDFHLRDDVILQAFPGVTNAKDVITVLSLVHKKRHRTAHPRIDHRLFDAAKKRMMTLEELTKSQRALAIRLLEEAIACRVRPVASLPVEQDRFACLRPDPKLGSKGRK